MAAQGLSLCLNTVSFITCCLCTVHTCLCGESSHVCSDLSCAPARVSVFLGDKSAGAGRVQPSPGASSD